eukprot:c14674_g1_i2.p1 GENE.c14674_g1_i2~~c14674_g1_i2.p1  ORF type:complete len:364 (-),score=77.67 c14674_g1_i2:597-1688(-)
MSSDPVSIIVNVEDEAHRTKLMRVDFPMKAEDFVRRCETELGSRAGTHRKLALKLPKYGPKQRPWIYITDLTTLRSGDTVFLQPDTIVKDENDSDRKWWEPVKTIACENAIHVPTMLKINIKRVKDVGRSLSFTVTVVQQCFPQHHVEGPFPLHLPFDGTNPNPNKSSVLRILTEESQLVGSGYAAVYRFTTDVQIRHIFDHWPFSVAIAEVSLQANTFHRNGDAIRPTLNVFPKNMDQLCRFDVPSTSVNWGFISKRPLVTVELQSRQGVVESKVITYTYFLQRIWVYQIINVLCPLLLVMAMSALTIYDFAFNYFVIQASLVVVVIIVVPTVRFSQHSPALPSAHSDPIASDISQVETETP